MVLDPIALDQELKTIAEEVYDWHGALREAPEIVIDPFLRHRAKLTRTHYDELAQFPEDDPLRLPLLRWTYALMEQRINAGWYSRAALHRYQKQYPVAGRDVSSMTVRRMVTELLKSAGRREHWWQELERHAGELSETEAVLWQRRQAIAGELGLSGPDEFELPNADVVGIARDALDACLPLLEEFSGSVERWLDGSLGHDKASAFPARLNEAQLSSWFREARLLEDVRLRTWELPERVAPASFVRALDELGREYCYAAAPSTQPFVIAHDPYRLDDYLSGATFASLLLNPSFVERHLGLVRNGQRDTLRMLAVVVLLEWAKRALRVCLRPAALASADEVVAAYRHGMREAFGVNAPASFTFVLLRLSSDDAQSFAGMALGVRRALRMVEQHDEDWFRSPRAVDQVRSEAQLSPETGVGTDELRSACAGLRDVVAGLL